MKHLNNTDRKKRRKKIINYYFKNPGTNLKELAKKFKTSEVTVSSAISEELTNRIENSKARKWAKL
tara:strand:+ start:613 stop:810 length:198 start_codon:yes stop_codon:yes gene_type:complete